MTVYYASTCTHMLTWKKKESYREQTTVIKLTVFEGKDKGLYLKSSNVPKKNSDLHAQRVDYLSA